MFSSLGPEAHRLNPRCPHRRIVPEPRGSANTAPASKASRGLARLWTSGHTPCPGLDSTYDGLPGIAGKCSRARRGKDESQGAGLRSVGRCIHPSRAPQSPRRPASRSAGTCTRTIDEPFGCRRYICTDPAPAQSDDVRPGIGACEDIRKDSGRR